MADFEKSSRTRLCQPLMGNLLIRTTQSHAHGSIHGDFPIILVCEILLYFLIAFCAYVAETQSQSDATVSEIAATSSSSSRQRHSDPQQYVVRAVSKPCSPYNSWQNLTVMLTDPSCSVLWSEKVHLDLHLDLKRSRTLERGLYCCRKTALGLSSTEEMFDFTECVIGLPLIALHFSSVPENIQGFLWQL